MTDRANNRDWWADRVRLLKAIQRSMRTHTVVANDLLEPMIEILDEDRESLIEAMQGESEWYDYHTVGHWIIQAEIHLEGLK